MGELLVDPSSRSTFSCCGWTPEHDRDALALEPRDRVCEHGRPGRVDDGDPGHAQDHDAHVADVGQLQKEVVGGAKNSGPSIR